MDYSLNEIAATTRKAVRGAGYPWGIADEAAANLYWMYSHWLNGCSHLVRVLRQLDQADLQDHTPDCLDLRWRASTGPLCPLMTSCAVTDRVRSLSETSSLTLEKVLEPLLLIRSVYYLAGFVESVRMNWLNYELVTDGRTIEGSDSLSGLLMDFSSPVENPGHNSDEKLKSEQLIASDNQVADVTLSFTGLSKDHKRGKRAAAFFVNPDDLNTRAQVESTIWHALEELAGRTYAPATEESRLKGAGSGLSDND